MRILLAAFLIVHGAIHLMGFAKAFGYADLPQLATRISPAWGVWWLVAAVLFVLAAVGLWWLPRWWWLVGVAAIAVSTVVILSAWRDAKFGMVANVVALGAVLVGLGLDGPGSFRAAYARDLETFASSAAQGPSITEADLLHLPSPIQRYLTVAGVVGHPHVRNFRARIHGRIRSDAGSRWMPLSVDQMNVVVPAVRLFYMDARMFGLPVAGYHRYVGAAATMRVRLAGWIPVANAAGATMTRSETVTLLNDLCLLAPAALVDVPIDWSPVDDRTVRATFSNAGHTVAATLVFNDAGELVDFWSDDRARGVDDRAMTTERWSTPVSAYGTFGPFHLMRTGEGRWHLATGEFAYIQLTLDDVRYNVGPE